MSLDLCLEQRNSAHFTKASRTINQFQEEGIMYHNQGN